MARIGVISICDGRDRVHEEIVGFIRTTRDRRAACQLIGDSPDEFRRAG